VGLGEKIICLVGAIGAAGRVDANVGRSILIFLGNSQLGVNVPCRKDKIKKSQPSAAPTGNRESL